MKSYPQLEVHKLNIDGVIVRVKLDYKRKVVSFVDENGNPEKFKFAERTMDYLGGWVRVFRALEEATLWADKKLAEEEARQDSEKEAKLIDLMIAVSDLERKKK